MPPRLCVRFTHSIRPSGSDSNQIPPRLCVRFTQSLLGQVVTILARFPHAFACDLPTLYWGKTVTMVTRLPRAFMCDLHTPYWAKRQRSQLEFPMPLCAIYTLPIGLNGNAQRLCVRFTHPLLGQTVARVAIFPSACVRFTHPLSGHVRC